MLHNEPICRAAKCPKSPVRAQQSTHYQAATRITCFYLTLPKHHHLFTHSMNDKTNKRNEMCGAALSAQNFCAPVGGCGKSPIIAFGCLHNSPSAPHHQIKHFKRFTRTECVFWGQGRMWLGYFCKVLKLYGEWKLDVGNLN